MELKEFVSQTLMQIIQGVKEAQEGAQKLGGVVNPTMNNFSENPNLKFVGSRGYSDDERVIYPVEFDVALTTAKSSGKKGSGGLSISSLITVGGQKESQASNSQDAQVKFVVPVLLPYDNHGFQARTSDPGTIEPDETSRVTKNY